MGSATCAVSVFSVGVLSAAVGYAVDKQSFTDVGVAVIAHHHRPVAVWLVLRVDVAVILPSDYTYSVGVFILITGSGSRWGPGWDLILGDSGPRSSGPDGAAKQQQGDSAMTAERADAERDHDSDR